MNEGRIETDVEELCAFERRLPGTDAERRASKWAAGRLSELGRGPTTDATYVQPQWPIVHLLHCALAAIGSMISPVAPIAGFVMVLVAATSAYLDLSARHYLIRRLPFRRASQNVHTLRPTSASGPTIILCANVDAPRTGAGYGARARSLSERAARSFPVASSPSRLWFWSIALLVPPLGARLAGFQPDWLAALQLPQTLVLIVACFLLGEIALSPASPGANANASGVAAVLDSIRRLAGDPPANLKVEALLLGGAETTEEGMRSFLRTHRADLDRELTWFVSLESVGRGSPRYLVSQGPAVSLPLDPELVALCAALSEAAPDDDSLPARALPLRDGRTSAAAVARSHGYRSLAITCRTEDEGLPLHHHTPEDLPAEVEGSSIDAAAAFTADVIRLLDRDLGRRSGTTSR